VTERFLFGVYELLAGSEFFDADYYRATCPDVVKLNMDPLTHYLELGCREHRNPSAKFDTKFYLEQCRRFGETPTNALLHYLTAGAKRGLAPNVTQDIQLHIDVPRLSGAAAEISKAGLSIVGWTNAPLGIGTVDISVDGARLVSARLGLPRSDVAKAFPHLSGADQSGFSAHIPPRAIAAGTHAVTIAARDRSGATKSVEFQIEVHEATEEPGPWNLCRRVPLARSAMAFASLEQMQWRPAFSLVVAYPIGAAAVKELQRTLDSLVRQVYPHWRLRLVTTGRSSSGRAVMLSKVLPGRHAGLVDRITVAHSQDRSYSDRKSTSLGEAKPDLMMFMAAGDELGADALLEWALASGRHRDAELIYSDERCPDPTSSNVEAFFKPAWSPDLLLATNYLGRAWCIRPSLLDRADLNADDLAGMDAYESVLRVSKAAKAIGHIPAVLYETSHAHLAAAKQAAARAAGRVSIVIPTDGQGDYIRQCVKSLRALTRHRDLEIICVASVAGLKGGMRQWLELNVDKVLGIREPFQWARFCNRGAAQATGRYLLFLDDGIEILAPGWLGAILLHGQRTEVGAVGSMLRTPDNSIAEAGLFLRPDGTLGRAFRHLGEGDLGYFGLASVPRNVTAISSKILLTSLKSFAALGGFQEDSPPDFSAADYCLRLRERGLHNVITPVPQLLQRKSEQVPLAAADEARFRKRWSRIVDSGDPYVNPNLMREQEMPVIEREPFEIVHCGAQLFTPASIQRILIIKLDHIGDCVTALPAVRRLKQHFPDAKLTVLCASSTVLLWGAEPAVSEILEFNLYQAQSGLGKHEIGANELQALVEQLRLKEFDLGVDLRKQPDSRYVLAECGARYRAGFNHQGRFAWLDVALEWDEDVPLRSKHGHVSHDLVALVDRVAQAAIAPTKNLSAMSTALRVPKSVARRLSEKPLICIHPGSGSPMRQWPIASFAGLINLLRDGKRFNIALIGGQEDSDLIAKIVNRSNRSSDVINLAGSTTLSEIPSLLSRAVLFVGNNSGPHHIAAALGIPTIGIHSGVVDVTEWGPLGTRAVAVRRRMSCSPCFLEKPTDCQRSMACLSELSVADVFRACQTLLPTEARVTG
jgi:lipopolysaccharide heptosyltransferase II